MVWCPPKWHSIGRVLYQACLFGSASCLQGSLKWMPGTQVHALHCYVLFQCIYMYGFTYPTVCCHEVSCTCSFPEMWVLLQTQGSRVCTRNWAESISSSFLDRTPLYSILVCNRRIYKCSLLPYPHFFYYLILFYF